VIALISLGPLDLALAALLILLNAGIGAALRLGLGRRILLAAGRAVVQLLLLGLVLAWVFRQEGPWAVLLMMIAMIALAGFEAVRRTTYRVPGIYAMSMGVMLVSSLTVTLYGLTVVIGTRPWYQPQYAIPILGMVLGNTLNGIALGLETVLDGFRRDRVPIEILLAHGATRGEASRDVVRRAVRVGMIPILNAMVAAGVISIPGMMTGQILAGGDPGDAARYQIFILFALAGGVALGTMGVVLGARHLVFDERDRLRGDRLRRTKE
jgi:UDP-glucose/iron transport system permease protein